MKKLFTILCAVVLTTILFPLPTAADTPYVAYWSFDTDGVEKFNGYTPDNPEAVNLVEGKNGKAYAGAGEDGADVVYYSDVDIPIMTGFTASCWAKGDFDVEYGTYFVFMAKNQKSTDGHFEFYWFPDGTFGCYGTNSSEAVNLKSDAPYDDGEWHHFTVIMVEGTYSLYIDGELNATFEGTDLIQAAGTLSFGGLINGTLPAQTNLDDVFFTNVVVSEEDIAKLMENTGEYAAELSAKTDAVVSAAPQDLPEPEPPVSPEGYVAYWSFDENGDEAYNGYTPENPEALTLVDGKVGKAYGGAGTEGTGYLTYDKLDIPLTKNFTISFWAKNSADVESGSYFVFLGKNIKSDKGHVEFYWFPDGNIGVYGTNPDEAVNIASTDALNDGTWHHYTLRMAETEYILYVDGAEAVRGTGTELTQIAGPFSIGSLSNGSLASQTEIDELLITTTLIPEEDVAMVMADTKGYAESLKGGVETDFSETDVSATDVTESDVSEPKAHETEIETVEPTAPETTPAVTEKAPQTFDAGIIAAAAAVVSAAGYTLTKKRR